MDDSFNMSMRKFLKQVGVTSQQAIEEGLRAKGAKAGESYEAKVHLTPSTGSTSITSSLAPSRVMIDPWPHVKRFWKS